MSTEAQKRASRKYYQTHKDYYKQKAIEDSKNVRKERNELRKRIEELENKLYGTRDTENRDS